LKSPLCHNRKGSATPVILPALPHLRKSAGLDREPAESNYRLHSSQIIDVVPWSPATRNQSAQDHQQKN
jgi:hypothetical protein